MQQIISIFLSCPYGDIWTCHCFDWIYSGSLPPPKSTRIFKLSFYLSKNWNSVKNKHLLKQKIFWADKRDRMKGITNTLPEGQLLSSRLSLRLAALQGFPMPWPHNAHATPHHIVCFLEYHFFPPILSWSCLCVALYISHGFPSFCDAQSPLWDPSCPREAPFPGTVS